MTTERHAWISTLNISVDERRALSPMCRCGQDLDICTGTHCPRCGATVAEANRPDQRPGRHHRRAS